MYFLHLRGRLRDCTSVVIALRAIPDLRRPAVTTVCAYLYLESNVNKAQDCLIGLVFINDAG